MKDKPKSVERIQAAVKRLEHYMEVRGETQPELSKKSGIDQPKISKILRGDYLPTPELLGRLLSALGIPPNDAYDEPDESQSPIVGYLATPLTNVAGSEHASAELERVVKLIRQVVSDAEFTDPPFHLYWPGDYTHPVLHANLPARQVYLTDRSHASSHDFVILFCAEPSYGVGQENEISAQAGVPVIRLLPSKISRMMTGSYVRAFDMAFEGSLKDRISFDHGVLKEHLKRVRVEHFQLRAYYKGMNGNVFREHLETLLHSRGVDAPKLAERIGSSVEYVEAMCRENIAISNPSIRLLKRIARQFDVSVSYLVEEKQPDHVLEDSERAWRSWLSERADVDGRIAVRIWNDWKENYALNVQVHGAATEKAHRLTLESMSAAAWDRKYWEAVKHGQSLFGTA